MTSAAEESFDEWRQDWLSRLDRMCAAVLAGDSQEVARLTRQQEEIIRRMRADLTPEANLRLDAVLRNP
jgi:phosphoserine phosphatase